MLLRNEIPIQKPSVYLPSVFSSTAYTSAFFSCTAEGIASIEQGVRDIRATGTVLGLPHYLALKAEALHLADRTTEALEAINEPEVLVEKSKDLKTAIGAPDYTGSAVCFSRL